MAKKFYYPPSPGNGSGTFSDNLVGLQFTQGSPQMTLGNFSITDSSREKNNRDFSFGGFSGPITLEQLSGGDIELTQVNLNNSLLVTFNYDDSDVSKFVLYGSLKERLRVSVQQIVNFFPAALYCSGVEEIFNTTGNTVENIMYDSVYDRTTLTISKHKISNPFNLEISTDGNILLDNSLQMDYVIDDPTHNTLTTQSIQAQTGKISKLRNFTLEHNKYVFSFSGSGGTEYPIVDYIAVDDNTTNLSVVVSGNPFNTTATTSTKTFYLKPNKFEVQTQFNTFGTVERFLLNQTSVPQYKAEIQLPKLSENGQNYVIKETLIWEKQDLWNIDVKTQKYTDYLKKLVEIGEELDGYKTNLISRFLTTGALKDFDSGDRKVEKTLQIYGRSFDDVKRFIDGIAYMNNVTYDGKNNVPNQLLKNLAKMLGWETPSPTTKEKFLDTVLDRYEPQYSGESIGVTPAELDVDIYRRILMNTAHLFKSKGTRKAIEFLFRFIGAPEALIEFNEYVVLADRRIKMGSQGRFGGEGKVCERLTFMWQELSCSDEGVSTLVNTTSNMRDEPSCAELKEYMIEKGCFVDGKNGFITEFEKISGGVVTQSQYVYDPTTQNTVISSFTQTHGFKREDYPIDSDGYPTQPRETSNYYFQRGAGWFEQTDKHHGDTILDLENSTFSGCSPTIITKLNQFSWGGFFGNLPLNVSSNEPGAPYLERFRKFPYMNMGFGLTPIVDDKKSWVAIDENNKNRNYSFETLRGSSYFVDNEKLVINVKNVDIFLNIGQALVYDFWQQSVLSGCTFNGTPLPPPYPQKGGVDDTVTLLNGKNYSFKNFTKVFWRTFINVKNRQTIDDGKTGGYPLLQKLYIDYLSQTCGDNNQYTYQKMLDYAQDLGTYWIRIIEQLVPATTLWQGGLKTENSLFHRDKFTYKHYPYYPLSGFTPTPDNGCVYGCTSPTALNFSPLATCDDGSCDWPDGIIAVVNPASGISTTCGCINTGSVQNIIDGTNENGETIIVPTKTCPCCTLPENSIVLEMRTDNVSCKSTWPSFDDYQKPSSTNNVGVNNSINLTTSKFTSNNPAINGGYNVISVMNNSVMFRVKKGLALSKNIEEPWGFKYRLEKKQRG
tara:strand:+ start:40340 stop:43678 length:3339 start_codon:yes stop_codon:yes gene_type:complete